jgi:membrane protease YdiL (CAAX protease family)
VTPLSRPRAEGSLLRFFAITYVVTWTFWLAAGTLIPARWPADTREPLRGFVMLLGTIAPALVALGLTARATGRAGVESLLRRVVAWQVPARWFVFALGYMAILKLTVALIHRLALGAWPRFGSEPWYVMLAAISISTWVQAGEEIGWRGYALPRLAGRFGLAGASIILGVIWACWHLPLFFLPGGDTYRQSFPLYLVQVTAVSVAMAWLYWRTNGSLLLTMLLHASINNTKDIVPSIVPNATNPFAPSPSLVAWLTAALLWIGAGYFLVRMTKAKPDVQAFRS